MPSLITSGVDYPEFLNDIRAMFRHEIQEQVKAVGFTATAQPTIGGIALAMEVTGLSKARIYNLCSERAIPHSKPVGGNKLYFNRAELLAWVAAGSREQQKTR